MPPLSTPKLGAKSRCRRLKSPFRRGLLRPSSMPTKISPLLAPLPVDDVDRSPKRRHRQKLLPTPRSRFLIGHVRCTMHPTEFLHRRDLSASAREVAWSLFASKLAGFTRIGQRALERGLSHNQLLVDDYFVDDAKFVDVGMTDHIDDQDDSGTVQESVAFSSCESPPPLTTESQEIAKDEALSKALGWNGARVLGKEAARAREHGMELAKGSESTYGGSDNVVASTEEKLSRVNASLSQQCVSEIEDFAWLTSLLDGLNMPKPSARTSAEVEYTSEPSQVMFRECDENEE